MTLSRRQQLLRRQSLARLAAFLGVLLLILLTILYVDNMLWSSLVAFVISYMLGPAVNFLERAGMHRVFATTLIFFAIGIILALSVSWLAPLISQQLMTLKNEFPQYIAGFSRLIAETEERLEVLVGSIYLVDLSQQIEGKLQPWATSIFEDFPNFIRTVLTTLLLAPFLAFFMIKDGRSATRTLLALVPNSIFEPMLNLYHQINEQMGQFVRARLLEAIIVGFVTWLGLFLINFPFAVLLAVFAALTNLIPYIGPIIGAVPAIVIALINGAAGADLLLVFLVYFIAQLIDAVFIIPLVVAKIVNLHPVTVIVAIIVGAQLLGVLGMLISIPVASVLKLTVGTVYRMTTDFRS